MRLTRNRATTLLAGALATSLLTRAMIRRMRAISFRDRVVLITGGSRGLGLVLARLFGNEGARVVICARNQEELERAASYLREQGILVMAVECDITDRERVEELVRTVQQRLGPIDVLINNAGVIQVGPADTMSRGDFDEALKVNLYGAMNLIDAVLPSMRARRFGRIANIASVGGRMAVPHLLPYSASKFALVGYSQGLRAELASSGVRVTTVCPGLMRTGSPHKATFKGKHREEYAWFSISDSLPFLSADAHEAAAKIMHACRVGQSDLIIGLPAQIAARAAGVAPGLTANLLGIVNRFLPSSNGDRASRFSGSESYSEWSPSSLTVLGEQAAARNNEVF
ncbi:SDR family NAD(P)-dependent oxidoreductase [Candidatus Laterigemmans baculatus]|uniref:SDR family NAD(P)-dependent oxidoreductase n=1 Tax=Candidatus Laterigemmans baculatus TaxID=2770505 RepID=UPI0013D9EA66|nr:SDR family oxidoreductase [Candidatus Laterigemmans baculatus]